MQKLILNGRYIVFSDGRIKSVETQKFLRPGKNSRGYMTVSLYDGATPRSRKSFLVHRLVLSAFLGDSNLQCNHKNGCKFDNRLENLEYCTAQENSRHSVNVLRKNCGEENGRRKLTKTEVVSMLESGQSAASISQTYGIPVRHASDILRGKYWQTTYQAIKGKTPK